MTGVNELNIQLYGLAAKDTVIMGINLAVFTAAVFWLAKFQCCFVANGKSPSEDPVTAYMTVLISNRI